jgi:hypothetical protein
MRAKKSIENPLRLPKTGASPADQVRARLAKLGLKKQDVALAVSWARKAQ